MSFIADDDELRDAFAEGDLRRVRDQFAYALDVALGRQEGGQPVDGPLPSVDELDDHLARGDERWVRVEHERICLLIVQARERASRERAFRSGLTAAGLFDKCATCGAFSAGHLFCINCELKGAPAVAAVLGVIGMALAIQDREPCASCGSNKAPRERRAHDGSLRCIDDTGCGIQRVRNIMCASCGSLSRTSPRERGPDGIVRCLDRNGCDIRQMRATVIERRR